MGSRLAGFQRYGRLPEQKPAHVAVVVALGFFCLLSVGILRHELWRDEMQAWMQSRDSTSLADLLQRTRYEGHPALWHFCLFLLSRTTRNPLAMQLFHVLVATAATWIFWRYAPFSKGLKLLFSLGYFPFYEYSVISRNYSLGWLLLFAFCALFRAQPQRYLALGAIVALLANTNVYQVLVAAGLILFLIADHYLRRHPSAPTFPKELMGGLAIAMMGLTIAITHASPPKDSGFAAGWHTGLDFGRIRETLATLVDGYFPIPGQFHHFWNTSLLSPLRLSFLLTVLLLFVFGRALSSSRPACLFYLAGTGAILLFSYVKYEGYTRHHGNLLLILIAAFWLAHESARPWGKATNTALIAILAVQMLVGLFAFSMDLLCPFSAGKETADYVRTHRELPPLLAGDPDYAVSTVAGYLDRPIYYPREDRMATYVVWNSARPFIRLRKILRRVRAHGAAYHADVLLILDREIPSHLISDRGPRFRLVRSFEKSIVRDEAFYLYKLPS